MSEWRVPLADVRLTEDDIGVVADVYRSGWLSQGPRVEAFERDLGRFVGAPFAIAVANGTAALQLIMAAARIGPGDEVIVPSLTFAATAAAVVHAGATPVFADIASVRRPWISTDTVEPLITARTRAIVSVGFGGHPGDAVELRALCDDRGLQLIEDAAHALGAQAGGACSGTIGHAGAYSFFANKNLALGEGGMVVTADEELAQRARLLRSHGLTAGTWQRHGGGQTGYEVVEPGFNFRLDEARAALGSRLLTRLAAENAARAVAAGRYRDALGQLPGLALPDEPGESECSAHHIFTVLVPAGADRDRVRERMHRAGIQTSLHYPSLHLTTGYAPFACGPLPATEGWSTRTLTLPLFGHLTERQHDAVVRAFVVALDEPES